MEKDNDVKEIDKVIPDLFVDIDSVPSRYLLAVLPAGHNSILYVFIQATFVALMAF